MSGGVSTTHLSPLMRCPLFSIYFHCFGSCFSSEDDSEVCPMLVTPLQHGEMWHPVHAHFHSSMFGHWEFRCTPLFCHRPQADAPTLLHRSSASILVCWCSHRITRRALAAAPHRGAASYDMPESIDLTVDFTFRTVRHHPPCDRAIACHCQNRSAQSPSPKHASFHTQTH